jgi:hypothetical protein
MRSRLIWVTVLVFNDSSALTQGLLRTSTRPSLCSDHPSPRDCISFHPLTLEADHTDASDVSLSVLILNDPPVHEFVSFKY